MLTIMARENKIVLILRPLGLGEGEEEFASNLMFNELGVRRFKWKHEDLSVSQDPRFLYKGFLQLGT